MVHKKTTSRQHYSPSAFSRLKELLRLRMEEKRALSGTPALFFCIRHGNTVMYSSIDTHSEDTVSPLKQSQSASWG